MAEIVDILAPPLGHGAQFTVNIAVASVPLTPIIVGSGQVMEAGSGAFKFDRGDNFVVLSAGYTIPENFVMAQYQSLGGANEYPYPVLFFQLAGALGYGPVPLRTVGASGSVRLPMENFEWSLGVFTDVENDIAIPEDFYILSLFPLIAGAPQPQVSMINAPAALDGVTIEVTPFIKVLHNLPLT